MGKLVTADPVPAERPINFTRRKRTRPIGTAQQEAFWSVLRDTDANAMLRARAGTGKSYSVREGMHQAIEADPAARVSYVAFNRSIADEFQNGLPIGATATTMHSAGFAALRSALPGLSNPDRNKIYRYADQVFPRRDKLSRQAKTALIRLVNLCKGHLIDDPSRDLSIRLCASHGLNIPKGFENRVFDHIGWMLESLLADTATIDFSDMVWMPVKMGLEFDQVDCLFVDEAQDLDPCQHALVQMIAGDGRLVIVGDDRQAIYGFRGADTQSMRSLGDALGETSRGLITLPLTQTRRCPSLHVEMAKHIVPDFEAMGEAIDGTVDEHVDDTSLHVGTMVLCRTNAPLVGMAFRLAGFGVPVAIQGRDIGEGMVRLIESFEAGSSADLIRKVETYRSAELLKLSEIDGSESDAAKLVDQCESINAAAKNVDTADQVASRMRDLFKDCSSAEQGSFVLLSSVHRAKGREADHVAIIEPQLMPHPMAWSPESRLQEENLIYVAATRSKDRLSFLGSIPSSLTA